MISIDSLIKQKLDITNLGRKIDDRIGGYRAAYKCAHNAAELDRRLQGFRSSAFRTVYVDAFGEPAVQKLARKYRTFLGFEKPSSNKIKVVEKASSKRQGSQHRTGMMNGSDKNLKELPHTIEMLPTTTAGGATANQNQRGMLLRRSNGERSH